MDCWVAYHRILLESLASIFCPGWVESSILPDRFRMDKISRDAGNSLADSEWLRSKEFEEDGRVEGRGDGF